ncbi:MAG: translocation/assembly module TamB domain-containing protein [Candidatus Schekmanbacteria bacterium]|nr:translocation/assembly module TamB domain-containing protein [Candidatus Schekmanbacteria bacterium]
MFSRFVRQVLKLQAVVFLGFAVLLVLVMAALHLPAVQQYLAAEICSAIGAKLDREVRVSRLRFTLAGWVSVDDFYLGGRAGFPGPFIHAGHVEARVDPLALIAGKVWVVRARIERPTVRVLFDETGRNNVPGPGNGDKNERERASDPIEKLFGWLYLDAVTFHEGVVLVEHRKSGVRVEAENVGGRLVGSADPVAYDIQLRPFSASVTIKEIIVIPAAVEHAEGTWTAAGFDFTAARASVLGGSSVLIANRVAILDLRDPSLVLAGELDADLSEVARTFRTQPMRGRARCDTAAAGVPSELLFQGAISADLVNTLGATIRAVRARYAVGGDGLRVSDVTARLAEGALEAELALQFGRPGRVPIVLDAVLNGARVSQLAAMYGLPNALTGLVTGRLHLEGPDVRFPSLVANGELAVLPGNDSPGETHLPSSSDLDIPVAARAPFRLENGRLSIPDVSVATPIASLGGRGHVDVRGDSLDLFAGARILDVGRLRRELDLALTKASLPTIPWHEMRGAGAASAHVSGKLRGAPLVDISAELVDVAWGTLEAGHLAADVRIDPGKRLLTIHRATAARLAGSPGLAGSLEASGTVSLRDSRPLSALISGDLPASVGRIRAPQMALRVRSHFLPSERLLDLIGANVPVQGLVDLELELTANSAAATGNAEMTLSRGTIAGLEVDRLLAVMQLLPGTLHAQGTALHGGERVAAELTLHHDGAYQVSLSTTPLELTLVERLLRRSLPVTGILSLSASGSGTLAHPAASLTIRGAHFRIKDSEDAWANLGGSHAELAVANGELSARVTFLELGHRAEGRLHFVPGYPGELRAFFAGLSVEQVLALAGQHKWTRLFGGNLDGQVAIRGPFQKPEKLVAEARIDRAGIKAAELPLQLTSVARPTLRDGHLDFDRLQLVGPSTALAISGFLDFSPPWKVGVHLEGDANLAVLQHFAAAIDEASGRVIAAVDLTGSAAGVTFGGRASVQDGRLHLRSLGAPIEQISGAVLFNGDRFRLDAFSATLGGGTLDASGTILLTKSIPDLQLAVKASGVQYRHTDGGFDAKLSGRISVAGPALTPEVSGEIQIDGGLYSRDLNYRGILGSRVLHLVLGYREVAPADAPAPPFDPRFRQLHVATVGNLRVENNIAQMSLHADVSLLGSFSRPGILGHIEATEGAIIFEGRRFKLLSGTFFFRNPTEINPEVDLEAEALIDQTQLTIRLSGQAPRIALEIDSDPPLSLGDKLALITLGKTGQQLAGSTGAVAGAEAGAYLTGELQERLAERMKAVWGFDRFGVDPIFASTERTAGLRLTVGKQVTEDLYVTYSFDVTGAQNQLVLLEYRLGEHASLVGERLEDGSYGANIKFSFRYE